MQREKLHYFLIVIIFIMSGCDYHADLTHYVPTAFPIKERIYVSNDALCEVNIFQIENKFKENFSLEKMNGTRSILVTNDYDVYESEVYAPWQETPITNDNLYDLSQARLALINAEKCLKSTIKYHSFIEDAYQTKGSYFTTYIGLILIFNFKENLLLVASSD